MFAGGTERTGRPASSNAVVASPLLSPNDTTPAQLALTTDSSSNDFPPLIGLIQSPHLTTPSPASAPVPDLSTPISSSPLRLAFALAMWFLPSTLVALFLIPLAAVRQVSAAALTMELEASERACYFVDCDQAGEKIGTSSSPAYPVPSATTRRP